MRKFKGLMFATLMVVLVAGVAQAAPINQGTDLFDQLGDAGIHNLNADSPQIEPANYWTQKTTSNGIKTPSSARFFLTSESTYEFGIFDAYDHDVRLKLFDVDSGRGWVSFNIASDNTVKASNGNTADFSSRVFGYYLNTGDAIYYSDDDPDRMIVFAGTGEILEYGSFASNDLLFAWDTAAFSPNDLYSTYGDFNDFIVIAEDVVPGIRTPRDDIPGVPEPSTLVLLGGGLLGLGIAGYRRMQKK